MSYSVDDPQTATEGLTSASGSDAVAREDGVGFLDLALVLTKHKRLIFGLPLLAAALAAGITWLLPNVYESTARILPPQQSQSTAAVMLGQLAGLSGLSAGALGVKNPNDMYVGMLKSRTVADNLIRRFDLKQVFDENTMVLTRKTLAEVTALSSGRDGIISISVEDEDPKRAAAMANAYVDELRSLTQTLAVTEASQRRLFFEKQVVQAKTGLGEAELALKETQEKTGLISLTDQGKAIIETVARMRAQIAAKEVQLGAMRSFATEDHPDYFRGQQELVGMRAQLTKLERSAEGASGDVMMPTRNVPGAGLEYVRKLREVKYYEAIYELLSKQLELARVDEAKETSLIQVLDVAVEADRRSKPRRLLICALVGVLVAIASVIAAFVLEALGNLSRRPELQEKYSVLKGRLGWK